MPPKKDSKKDAKKDAPPEVATLYVRREPLPPREQPDSSDAADAWKTVRGMYAMPFPDWDDKAVDVTEWKPNETDTLFSSTEFAAKMLPKPFQQCMTTWRRAPVATDPSAPEEAEPRAEPMPEVEESPQELDPKAKAKAKADAKAKAKPRKGSAEELDPSAKPTTAQQFAEVNYEGESCVVTPQEFRTREFQLTNDDAMPPLSQAIAAQFAVISEHRELIPRGQYLWEQIFPQGEDGVPLFNPHGKYVVRLFLHGKWRQVLIDDIVPIGVASNTQSPSAPVFPASVAPTTLWPQLLSKALLRAFQTDLRAITLPVVSALTGWLPYQLPMSWDALNNSHGTRPFCCVQMPSQIDVEARQREALLVASTQPESDQRAGRKVGGATGPNVPALNLSGQAVPKLASLPCDAVPLQFLVCEVEADPPQVRLKSASWRPQGGTPRRALSKEAESEGEEVDDGMAPRRSNDAMDMDSEAEENDEDDDERRSVQSPSGGEPGLQSARSKEVEDNVDEPPRPGGGEDCDEETESMVGAPPWPDSCPSPPMLTSVMQEHHRNLVGGFWMSFDNLEQSCENFVTYMPPSSRMLSASLDSMWGNGRKEAYVPSQYRLLRLRLKSEVPKSRSDSSVPGGGPSVGHGGSGGGDSHERAPKGPQWHRAVFIYEPLRADPNVAGGKEASAMATTSCLLQLMGQSQAPGVEQAAPSYIHLATGDSARGGVVMKSVLLPPGDHWYLVFDDANRAGSVLSVHVDGASLNLQESRIEFQQPAEALLKKGVPVMPLEQTEYPAQAGFSVWAKAEVTLADEVAACVDFMQILSFVSDPALRQKLQVTFLRLTESADAPRQSRCAAWAVETLVRAPLLRLMALPLRGREEDGRSTKYIVMLEASVPTPAPAGNFSLQMMLPQYTKKGGAIEDMEEFMQVTSLKADHVLRWRGDTAPNDKGLVLCERLTVPVGAGDVSALLRVAVCGLPGAFLGARLVAQLPPREETRHREEGAATPEPLALGALIDPRDYGGRRSWLSRCKTVAEEGGVEVVTLPHIILCEGSTYILYVMLDPFKGPAKLEEGQWLLELYGSGEVEAGADTMEQDLEVLVRKSWEDPTQEPNQPSRQERAAASRERWLKKHRPDEDAEGGAAAGEAGGEAAAALADEEETGELRRAQERVANKTHANAVLRDFVNIHTEVEPVLCVEDPYVVAKDPPLELPPVDEPPLPEEETDSPEHVARLALGKVGLEEVRQETVSSSQAEWESITTEMEAAKNKNLGLLAELAVWQEKRASSKLKFLEERERLKDALQLRFQKQSDLTESVGNPDRVDTAALQGALESAKEAGVGVWNSELIEKAELKLSFLEALTALKAAVAGAEAEEALADAAAREAFARSAGEARELLEKVKAKRVPLPQDLAIEETLEKAEELLEQPAVDRPA